MSRTIVIEMTEEVTTTYVVDDDWLAEHGLPLNADTLSSGDFDDELFEAIDAIDTRNVDEIDRHQIEFTVTEREFSVTTKKED